MVNLLLEKGADINATDDQGFTTLSTAVRTNNSLVVEKLLKKGASPNARDNDGSTALYVAFTYFDPEMKGLLLGYGG
jgi:ankyrin repeat protein